jgi:hypothetical protein
MGQSARSGERDACRECGEPGSVRVRSPEMERALLRAARILARGMERQRGGTWRPVVRPLVLCDRCAGGDDRRDPEAT